MATGLDSFTLLAIPCLILAGQPMNRSGIACRLIDLARSFLGPLPGGLAFVNVLASMLFGAISGSAVAASAIGATVGPRMVDEAYDRDFAAAVNITAATTGLVIPPSNVLIAYSLAGGGASIAALFLAGYLPGLLTGFLPTGTWSPVGEVERVVRPLLPLFVAMLIALALVTAFPGLSLWLPSLFGY